MLQVILLILKVIGILLLALIGLVLLLLLLVLFCPIRYRFQAEYQEKFSGQGRVRWLYPLLDVGIEIRDNKPKILIRIFCIPWDKIKSWMKEKKQKKLERKRLRRKRQREKAKKKTNKKKQTGSVVKKSVSTTSVKKTVNNPPPVETKVIPPKVLEQPVIEEQGKNGTVKGKILAIKDKILQGKNKIVNLWGQWEEIKAFLAMETTKNSLWLIWNQLKRLLRHLKPRKLQVWLHYGTGDPYTLGQHLTALAIVYGLFGPFIQVEPEWDDKVLEGRGLVKGRVRLFVLVRIALKVITNKDFKILWKQISERRQSK